MAVEEEAIAAAVVVVVVVGDDEDAVEEAESRFVLDEGIMEAVIRWFFVFTGYSKFEFLI